jgi:hypothetical protein
MAKVLPVVSARFFAFTNREVVSARKSEISPVAGFNGKSLTGCVGAIFCIHESGGCVGAFF